MKGKMHRVTKMLSLEPNAQNTVLRGFSPSCENSTKVL